MCTTILSFHIDGTKMTDKNPRPASSPDSDFTNQWPDLELSEYLKFDDDQWADDGPESFVSEHVLNQDNQANEAGEFGGSSSHFEESSSRDISSEPEKKEVKDKVAFRTKSEVEILDDGFKWRKYGKKMVKNSPNPRCSVDGCPVKKRVERDRDDPRYVITTYEGNHTHPSPC
ncbi:probable WRKY transcription factor 50 isoform X2 [Gastrolobium bilobum]|uniref:probable WRKY transcription factor 50 isoform X2 n=1 Tax=Gastrolobium bilobum TaxID=150636 RepID=UPI002AB2155F|nr:probable WRKY transcription factor 50 isoform X2 [Gastrolobium bilobum]